MAEGLAIAMLVSLLVFILLGFPVAYTLAGTAVLFGTLGAALDVFVINDFGFIPNRIWGVMTNYTLVAVPMFIFMGLTLEKSGIAHELLRVMSQMLAKRRGSLALAVVIVGSLLAASTGIVGATVVTMGLLALPIMLQDGYSPRLASGVISSSGTLGQIIPPSIVLVLLGDIMNQDVGNLFVAALIPGLLLVVAYLLYVFLLTRWRPHYFPEPREQSTINVKDFLRSIFPPIFILVLVMGSIIGGLASPTEASSCGAMGALIIALWRQTLSRQEFKNICMKTVRLTTMVFTLLIGAQFFGVVFLGLHGDSLIHRLIAHQSMEPTFILITILALIFVLGFFLDFLEISFIVIPLVLPILIAAKLNLIWVAILFAVNLQTSFLTPPFGFALFYLRGVAPDSVKTWDIYMGALPFVVIQLVILAILFVFPELITWLPAQVFGKK